MTLFDAGVPHNLQREPAPIETPPAARSQQVSGPGPPADLASRPAGHGPASASQHKLVLARQDTELAYVSR